MTPHHPPTAPWTLCPSMCSSLFWFSMQDFHCRKKPQEPGFLFPWSRPHLTTSTDGRDIS